MTLPDLLIVGAQKCGTTWLHRQLSLDDRIFMSTPKELYFFSDTNRVQHQMERYASRFASPTAYAYRGESSTSYFWVPERADSPMASGIYNRDTPGVIYDTLGASVKIIICLRHPVARAVSAYFHHYRAGRITADQRLTDEMQGNNILEFGYFHRHLSAYRQCFPHENIHVVFLADIRRRPRQVLQEVYRFLDLPPKRLTVISPQNRGQGYACIGDRIYQRSDVDFWDRWLGRPPDGSRPYVALSELENLQRQYEEDMMQLAALYPEAVARWQRIKGEALLKVM